MSALDDFNTACLGASAAIEADDFALALKKGLVALALLPMLPDTEGGGESVKWDRESLRTLVGEARRGVKSSQALSGGVLNESRVRYVRG